MMDADTIAAIKEAYSRLGTWRAVGDALGINHATLCGIAHGRQASAALTRRVRRALGLPVAKRRRLVRPVASAEHEARRQRIGVTWQDVHEAGLAALESRADNMP